jgi:phage terminase large subunit
LAAWVNSRGIDSDFVKIRVLGEHPSQSEEQFIGEDLVLAAQQREATPYLHLPKVLGVDVATTGRTVLILRQGCKILWDQWFFSKGVEEVAAIVSGFMDKEQPDAVFVDSVGVGAGVYGLLRHTHHRVIAANGAHAVPEFPDGPGELPADQIYWNMRACMYGRMREWLRTVGCLPLRAQVAAEVETQYVGLGKELQQPFWRYAVRGGYTLILIESKDDMKERGIGSPDEADALSLTFYAPVRPQGGPVAPPGHRYATPAGSPHAPRLGAHRPQRAQGGWGGRR